MDEQPEQKELTEEEALAQAREQGVEFVDSFSVDGAETAYATREEAEAVANGKNIIQTRRQMTEQEKAERDNV